MYSGKGCPTQSDLASFTRSQTQIVEGARIAQHLHGCKDCQQLAIQLEPGEDDRWAEADPMNTLGLHPYSG